MSYQEIKNRQPVLFECFFAFSNSQFDEGVKKAGIEGKKIYRGIGGLYGTQEGIQRLYDDYEKIDAEIAEKCDPQEAYDYEFINHECDYVGSDTEAIKIIVATFGYERAKAVNRRRARVLIDNLKFE